MHLNLNAGDWVNRGLRANEENLRGVNFRFFPNTQYNSEKVVFFNIEDLSRRSIK